ncbi:MAG: hypothetical protein H0W84_06205 [Bacteroidetes bacterium]|nr:hypothetical protein [Bacteroidota bacterium]
MTEQKEHLEAIKDIRSMMERSSRFISLSGLSGIFAGLFALCGAYAAYLEFRTYDSMDYNELYLNSSPPYTHLSISLAMIASIVLFSSITGGVFLTIRNSKRKGIKVWDAASKRLLINLLIPLVSGGFFCLILLLHGLIGLVAPATLLFYGLALINASKYTFNDIRYLGLCEIVLGLAASVFMGYGLLFWAIGFGLLHIIYGTVMYFKYERD